MTQAETSPDSGSSSNEKGTDERELRYKAEEIVRSSFRSSPQYKRLVAETMNALRQVQREIDKQTWQAH